MEYELSSSPEIVKPTILVNANQMKEIVDWKVGGEYTLEIKVKQRSYSEYLGAAPNATLQIESYKVK